MTILALDCATKTGWAAYTRDGTDPLITSGVQDFSKRRGESNGLMFLRFRKWLQEMNHYLDGIGLVIYERAHHRGGASTEIGVNLTGRAQEFAAEIGAECAAVHTGTLKKQTIGRGNASKGEMMAWFEGRTGRKPIDDNEADAYALLMYGIDNYLLEASK